MDKEFYFGMNNKNSKELGKITKEYLENYILKKIL